MLLLAGSLALSAIVAEIGLRIAGFSSVVFERPDPVRGTALLPFASGWQTTEGRAYVAINSHGYRDQERATVKPAGTYRIAVLGDSFVEARQVDLARTFCAVLERLLNVDPRFAGLRVEVLNFGVAGYGTAQEWLTLKQDVLSFHPDQVVVAMFTGNDISDNSKALSHPLDTRPYFVLNGEALVEDSSFRESPAFTDRSGWLAGLFFSTQEYSRLAQLAYRASRALRRSPPPLADEPVSPFNQPGLPHNIYREPVNAAWQDAWRVTERLLIEMREQCARQSVSFGVVTLSNPPQVNPDSARRRAYEKQLGVADLFYPERRVTAVGERAGFPVLTLAPTFQAYANEHDVLLHGFPNIEPGMGHWNEDAHRLAAESIAAWLAPPVSRPR